MNPAEVLETRYLPLLHQAAEQLAAQHPTFLLSASSFPADPAAACKDYDIYLEAWRPDLAHPDEPNCLDLAIIVRDLPGTPALRALGVGWGADGIPPTDGLHLLPGQVPFTPEVLPLIDAALPRLLSHFAHCLRAWEAAYPQHP